MGTRKNAIRRNKKGHYWWRRVKLCCGFIWRGDECIAIGRGYVAGDVKNSGQEPVGPKRAVYKVRRLNSSINRKITPEQGLEPWTVRLKAQCSTD